MRCAEDLAFVPNVTSGVNTVLHSLSFAPGDELLVTNHGSKAVDTAIEMLVPCGFVNLLGIGAVRKFMKTHGTIYTGDPERPLSATN